MKKAVARLRDGTVACAACLETVKEPIIHWEIGACDYCTEDVIPAGDGSALLCIHCFKKEYPDNEIPVFGWIKGKCTKCE